MYRLSTSLILGSGPEYHRWLDGQGQGRETLQFRGERNLRTDNHHDDPGYRDNPCEPHDQLTLDEIERIAI